MNKAIALKLSQAYKLERQLSLELGYHDALLDITDAGKDEESIKLYIMYRKRYNTIKLRLQVITRNFNLLLAKVLLLEYPNNQDLIKNFYKEQEVNNG